MQISWIMSRYIFLRSLVGFLLIFAGLNILFLIFDLAELLRKTGSEANVGFLQVVEMAFLRLPYLSQKLLPFAMLFGAIFSFVRLTRSQELTVIRAAGVSVWQFLLPAIAMALTVSVFVLAIYDPLAAVFLKRYESIESRLISDKASLLVVSSSGLWVRQKDENNGYSMLHGQHLDENTKVMSDVTVLRFTGDNNFLSRIDADSAQLTEGEWEINNAWVSKQGGAPKKEAAVTIPTDLTLTKLQDSFSAPETLSFWALPGFIKTLQNSGFSASRHRLHWHAQLATPILLVGMLLVAATFSMRPQRQGGTGRLVIMGILVGFVIHFFSDVVSAYGLSGQIPLVLSAWGPSLIVLFLSITALLHLEDG